MDFEWDERKRLSNLVKHRVDFLRASEIFEGPFAGTIDSRREYGEVRYGAYGVAGKEVLYVVYTMRGERCRIVSARKAGRDEAKSYYADIGGRGPASPED